jgi:cyclic pyranopterin phosphate synthase
MRAHEILAIAQACVSLGVRKIRLTGGEPLVRRDFAQILESLATLPVELALTTNGIRIPHLIGALKRAGVRKVNVSLDTLDPERFFRMTRRARHAEVLRAIDELLEFGFEVKVNCVLIRGLNSDEIPRWLEFLRDRMVELRFIEFMPFEGNAWSPEKVVPFEDILAQLPQGSLREDQRPGETAARVRIPGARGWIGGISTLTEPFCSTCNRLRITADGKLKNCLFAADETDLLQALRSGMDLAPLILESVRAKRPERGGQFAPDLRAVEPARIQNRAMIAIGG